MIDSNLRIGTDIVSVSRIADLIRTGGDRFLSRWFSPDEINYCSSKNYPERHFAARLAAKEATLKALHGKWTRVPWRDVEIIHDEMGAPALLLSGQLRSHVESNGFRDLRVSLSHCNDFATATVIVKEGRSHVHQADC